MTDRSEPITLAFSYEAALEALRAFSEALTAEIQGIEADGPGGPVWRLLPGLVATRRLLHDTREELEKEEPAVYHLALRRTE